MPQLITQDAAIAALSDFHSELSAAIYAAWATWQADFAPQLPRFFGRTQCCNLHDLAMRELTTRIGGHQRVTLSNNQAPNRFYALIEPEGILLRIKKVDSLFRVRNYRTRTAQRFNDQRPLPGVPDVPRLTLAYQLSPDRTELLGVFIALLRVDTVIWKYELPAPGAQVLPLPAQGTLQLEQPVVKLKKPSSKDETEGDG